MLPFQKEEKPADIGLLPCYHVTLQNHLAGEENSFTLLSLHLFARICKNLQVLATPPPFSRRARAMLDVHQRLSKVIKGYQSLNPRPRHPTPNGGKLHQTAPEIFPVLRRSGSPKEDAPLDQSQATGLSHTSSPTGRARQGRASLVLFSLHLLCCSNSGQRPGFIGRAWVLINTQLSVGCLSGWSNRATVSNGFSLLAPASNRDIVPSPVFIGQNDDFKP